MPSKTLTKQLLIQELATRTGIGRHIVRSLLATITKVALEQLKDNGEFRFPGVGKIFSKKSITFAPQEAEPDSNQRGLAGEYYVASLFNYAGYDTALTIGSSKSYDVFVNGPHGSRVAIQVKANLWHYDWLVREDFPQIEGNFVVFIRLPRNRDMPRLPELYVLTPQQANRLINRSYSTHSPRIPRQGILEQGAIDHDLSAIFTYLNREA